MLSPEGEVLCVISKRKATWYISKNIAGRRHERSNDVELVSEEPVVIKLKFQPNGKGHVGDDYYLAPKDNQCVACGNTQECIDSLSMDRYFHCFFSFCCQFGSKKK